MSKSYRDVTEGAKPCPASAAPDGRAYPIPSASEIKAQFEEISSRAEDYRLSGRRIVVVQGLGFVGTAAAAVIAGASDDSGRPLYFVIGVDLPAPSSYWKVAKLKEGSTPFSSPDTELSKLIYESVHKRCNLCVTTSAAAYSIADIIAVDVPLDVLNRLPRDKADIKINLEVFKSAIREIGRHMRPEALVLIETTVPVGTCENVIAPLLREERKKRGIKEPLFLAHAYERVMPGPCYVDSIRRFWRSFAGIDKRSAVRARDFLSSFIDTDSFPLRELESPNSSELAKLLENSYRAANIAFIHEWTLLAERIGVNLFAVIDSIRIRKGTHDNMRLPGFGVGGYCLTKDPLLAQWSASNFSGGELALNMTLDALNVNYHMPLHTLDLLSELSESGLSGKNIAVCGVTYLPGVADTRNSPSELLVEKLIETGANVMVHDPCVKVWRERPDIPIVNELSECLKRGDGIVFATAHELYRDLPADAFLRLRKGPAPFIVDAQDIISDEKANSLHEGGCRLLGVGKGHWRKRGYQCRK